MWLKNCWQAAAYAGEVTNALFPRRICGEDIVFFRTSAGKAVALADRCIHRSLPLTRGRLQNDIVQCGYHGMCYNADGEALSVPGQNTLGGRARIRSYPLVEKWQMLWIWMGDPALAGEHDVPDIWYFDDPGWKAVFGYHHINADYRLVNDNLLDLSHESFVHSDTIGNSFVADSPATAQIVDGTVRVHRFMANSDPPPYYVRTSGFTEKIDRWHTSIYSPPGICIIENGSMPAGSDKSLARERRVINLMTPETATSTHYFIATARPYDLDDTELDEYIRQRSGSTLAEDKIVLEAQQRALGSNFDEPVTFSIRLDAGPILGRRLLAAAIEAENAGAATV